MRARKYLILSFILIIAMIPFPGCEDFDEDWDGNSGEGEVDGRLSIGGSDSGLKGTYFHNSDFSEEAFQRLDATINFDWGNGSPDRRLGSNTFSVRWTGFVTPEFSETYTFYTVSDDGIRLFVDGRRIIENWTDHAPTENRGTIALQAGKSYPIKLEFYENGGGAVARLLWSSRSRSRQTIPRERLSPIKKDKVENVALGKSASQSSTLVGAVASRAVDGNTSSSFWDGSVTHTKDSRSPWWRVDLGGAHRVDSVTLFNRTDCCSQRLSNFHVDLLDESGRVIAKKDHPRQAPTKTDISLAGSGVHAVRVQLYGEDPLSLAEVQVYGAPEEGDCHTYPPGHSSYCTSDCPCGENEGDCDRDSQCQDGLVCELQSGTDFCVKPDDENCHTNPPGHSSYCTSDCPCAEGEGDCDRDSQCQDGLVCKLQSGTDFCVQPGIHVSQGRESYDGLWGGEHVKLRDVWEKNWSEGLSSREKYLLVSNNDSSQSRVKEGAQTNGFSVLAQEGDNDSGATLLRVETGSQKDGLKAILDVGKITITAVTTDGTLKHDGGGKQDGEDKRRQAFGSTDNTNTGGGVYHLDINANEDGVTIWDRDNPCKNFRGGFMYLRWE